MVNLIEKARKNIVTYGLYITIPDPQIIEMVKASGYDFARLDAEHIYFSPKILEEMFRTARLLDFPLQIRVNSMEYLEPILSWEPAAIMLPGTPNIDMAKKLVNITKFAPEGTRARYSYTDAIRFGGISRDEYLATANERLHTIVQIESSEGLENLEEIVQLPGVDMISSGKMDLSQALGIPGQVNHPAVVEAEERIVKTALKYGKIPTLMIQDKKRIRKLHDMGVNCFVLGFDSALCMNAWKKNLDDLRL